MNKLTIGSGLLLLMLASTARAEPPVDPEHATKMAASQKIFTGEVRKWLIDNCLECHGAGKLKSGFSLATRELLLQGGDNGQAVVAGKSGDSPLVKFIAHEELPHMPPKKPAAPKEIVAAVRKWIDLGAAYDKPLIESAVGKAARIVTDKDREYWAYRPLQKQPVPEVPNNTWSQTPIDKFLLAKMEGHGVVPAPDADRRTLIRRVYFDVIGLPPEPEAVEAFVNAPDLDKAWEGVVDTLLASPQHGERWARHWLDPARFGESHGFEHDYDRPFAYHYRDFVIRAFNDDLPYDQFLKWQIAGDELAPDNPQALAATGFLGAGVFPTQITTSEAERVRFDALDDMLSTTGYTMLALSVGCARCHDHKFDPIPAKDYYQLLSAFTTTVRSELDWDFGTEAEKAAMREYEAKLKPLTDARTKDDAEDLGVRLQKWVDEQRAKQAPLPEIADPKTKELVASLWSAAQTYDKLDKPGKDVVRNWYKPQDSTWTARETQIRELEQLKPKETRTKIQICSEGVKPMRHHVSDGSIPDFYDKMYILKRGDPAQKEGEAEPGFLQVLMRGGTAPQHWAETKPTGARTSFRRSSLAKWLTDAESGAGALAARVIVNRLWHHHFGKGIVATINDFGLQGEAPTHPELLEWLANDFVQNGWKLKRLHKQILMSRGYRLSGTAQENRQPDPDNRWLWKRARHRLEAEAVRDNLLAVGGLLDKTLYGPGSLNEGMRRRSIYFFVKRSQLIPMLQVFDWPDSLTSAGARPNTVVAPQALLFLNNPQVAAAAQGFANRIRPQAEKTLAEGIAQAYLIAFSRLPSTSELQTGEAFINERKTTRGNLPAALTDYCHALMGLNEFIYVD